MNSAEFTVSLLGVVDEFHLEKIFVPDGWENRQIYSDDVNRPGLQLAGFFDYFDPTRLQILGKVENTFISTFTGKERLEIFEKYFEKDISALIFTRNMDIAEECLVMAKKHNIPLFKTPEVTSSFLAAVISFLKVNLAQRVTLHGVLVEIYGEGVLLLGDSGVGKSETAIELVKRGHRLIADDAVEIKKVSAKTLVGSAPEIIRHFIELRGIGIVDVRHIFGMGAVKMTEKVDLIINLEAWVEGKAYDRLGLDSQHTDIMDIKVPSLTVPVKPGRNLAIIIEVASMNNRQKKMGFNAAQELSDRMTKKFNMPKMEPDIK